MWPLLNGPGQCATTVRHFTTLLPPPHAAWYLVCTAWFKKHQADWSSPKRSILLSVLDWLCFLLKISISLWIVNWLIGLCTKTYEVSKLNQSKRGNVSCSILALTAFAFEHHQFEFLHWNFLNHTTICTARFSWSTSSINPTINYQRFCLCHLFTFFLNRLNSREKF